MGDSVAEYQIYKNSCGAFEQNRGILKISGPDAADFLHRLTTQNIKVMTPGTGSPAALLQANAMMISLFDLYHSGNFFLVVTDEPRRQITFDHLEKMHFAENLVIEDLTHQFKFVSLQGARSREVLQKTLGRVPSGLGEILGAEEAFIAFGSDFEGTGYHLLIKSSTFASVVDRLKKAGAAFLSQDLWDLLRVEAGHFSFGVDVTEKNLILESAAADYVSRNKGCYPGQEIVERVFTYGNVAKKLVGLKFGAGFVKAPTTGAKIFAGDKEIGIVTSGVVLPWTHEVVALGMVRKPFYESGNEVRVEGVATPAEVVALPHSFDIDKEKPA